MTVRQCSNESLKDFLKRFRNAIAEIPDLVEQLIINYLAAGIDSNRHSTLVEELFEKNPRSLQAAFQIIEHRMTLQEAVGSIRSPKRLSQ